MSDMRTRETFVIPTVGRFGFTYLIRLVAARAKVSVATGTQ